MGLFKCLNFQSFPLYLSKRKASVHFHEQMPCLKAVFLQPHNCKLCSETGLVKRFHENTIASSSYMEGCI